MRNRNLVKQLDCLKESCNQAMSYSTCRLSYNLKILLALADAVYIRDYLNSLFEKWEKELPFIGDKDFINCDWGEEEKAIRRLASEIEDNLKDYICQDPELELPPLNTPSDVEPLDYSSLVLGEQYGNIPPDRWDKLLKEKRPINDETVGWAVAKELNPQDTIQKSEVEIAAIRIIQKAIPFIGHYRYLNYMDCKLTEVLEDIADSLKKIHLLLTQPQTVIKDKYQLEDVFTAFFKRVYMEYALDCGGYEECCNEFEAFRNAYIGEKDWNNDYNLDFRPWLEGEKYQDFICSGFMEPYVRNHGQLLNGIDYSEFCKIFPAPVYGGKGYASEGFTFFNTDDSKWRLHNNVGRYTYCNQLREKDWADKTKALLRFFLFIDLCKAENSCNGVSSNIGEVIKENKATRRGRKEGLLFSDKEKENKMAKEFVRFLKKHKKSKEVIDTSEENFINLALVIFYKLEEPRVPLNGSAARRFLVDECELELVEVSEKSYDAFIRKFFREKDNSELSSKTEERLKEMIRMVKDFKEQKGAV